DGPEYFGRNKEVRLYRQALRSGRLIRLRRVAQRHSAERCTQAEAGNSWHYSAVYFDLMRNTRQLLMSIVKLRLLRWCCPLLATMPLPVVARNQGTSTAAAEV